MKWYQRVEVEKAGFAISHADQICSIGSCFSENVGDLLQKSGFEVAMNPNGILFNPSSLAFAMSELNKSNESGIVENEDLWVSLNHHGSFSKGTKDELLLCIAQKKASFLKALVQAKILIVTFGTAQVWRHLSSDQIAANCHKLPTQEFRSEMLNVDSIVKEWNAVLHEMSQLNPALKVVFTVSPVRYKRGGAQLNTLSKSILHLAVKELCDSNDHANYFPAYEICLDELRDYRFFTADFAHPTSLAIDHIYERFAEAYMSEETKAISAKIAHLNKRLEHNYPTHQELEIERIKVAAKLKNLLSSVSHRHGKKKPTP